jgi:hypothetical protein
LPNSIGAPLRWDIIYASSAHLRIIRVELLAALRLFDAPVDGVAGNPSGISIAILHFSLPQRCDVRNDNWKM